MKKVARTLLAVALAALIVSPLAAADDDAKKADKADAKKKRQAKRTAQVVRVPKTLELTKDQQDQVAAINKEFGAKFSEAQKKLSGLLTPEQRKARHCSRQESPRREAERQKVAGSHCRSTQPHRRSEEADERCPGRRAGRPQAGEREVPRHSHAGTEKAGPPGRRQEKEESQAGSRGVVPALCHLSRLSRSEILNGFRSGFFARTQIQQQLLTMANASSYPPPKSTRVISEILYRFRCLIPLGIRVDFFENERSAGDFDNPADLTNIWINLFTVNRSERGAFRSRLQQGRHSREIDVGIVRPCFVSEGQGTFDKF